MPTDSENVCFLGKTGSEKPAVKTALMTQRGPMVRRNFNHSLVGVVCSLLVGVEEQRAYEASGVYHSDRWRWGDVHTRCTSATDRTKAPDGRADVLCRKRCVRAVHV